MNRIEQAVDRLTSLQAGRSGRTHRDAPLPDPRDDLLDTDITTQIAMRAARQAAADSAAHAAAQVTREARERAASIRQDGSLARTEEARRAVEDATRLRDQAASAAAQAAAVEAERRALAEAQRQAALKVIAREQAARQAAAEQAAIEQAAIDLAAAEQAAAEQEAQARAAQARAAAAKAAAARVVAERMAREKVASEQAAVAEQAAAERAAAERAAAERAAAERAAEERAAEELPRAPVEAIGPAEALALAERARKRRQALERAARQARAQRDAIDARYPAEPGDPIDHDPMVVGSAKTVPGPRLVRPLASIGRSGASRPVQPNFKLKSRDDAPFNADPARDQSPTRAARLRAALAESPTDVAQDERVDPDSQTGSTITKEDDDTRHQGSDGGKRLLSIDLTQLYAEDYLKPEGKSGDKAGVLMEEFRRIKRPLLANAYGQGLPKALNGERIMVTSALPNEGKSFCAIHLALSIASEVDSSVILVEADLAKPTILRKLGHARPMRGLTNWCADPRLDVRDLVVRTSIDGLRILPAGRGAPQSINLLASRAMKSFFDRLREAFPNDLIVVDAPPLLPATETKVLATLMGQVVVVVEAGSTPKAVVGDALEMLKDIEIVGLVLNKSLRQSKEAGYGYGYGY